MDYYEKKTGIRRAFIKKKLFQREDIIDGLVMARQFLFVMTAY